MDGFERKDCENMLCRDCGLRIHKIPGYIWDESKISYLFFRTNFGDTSRLAQALIRRAESAAYSCGCKGCSVSGSYAPLGSEFQWKCTGCYS